MKNINKLTLVLAVLVLLSALSYGQAAFTTTTTTQPISPSSSIVCLASLTSVNAEVGPQGIHTVLFVDHEAMAVQTILSTTSNCVQVVRGYRGTYAGGSPSNIGGTISHLSGALVYVGPDDQYHFNGSAAYPSPELRGACYANQQSVLPVIEVYSGQAFTCTGNPGKWGSIRALYIPPTQCTFFPTTSTVTNTYPQVGASNVFVLNGTTNGAAGTTTLTCNILPITNVTTSQGTYLQDITTFVGSQTNAPTSVGTATLGAITFPAPATSETPSTVTPVATGGTVTTTTPTAITSVTTAGAFLTIQSKFASLVNLSTDLQALQYTLPFGNTNAAAMTLNTPGLLLHVVEIPTLY